MRSVYINRYGPESGLYRSGIEHTHEHVLSCKQTSKYCINEEKNTKFVKFVKISGPDGVMRFLNRTLTQFKMLLEILEKNIKHDI